MSLSVLSGAALTEPASQLRDRLHAFIFSRVRSRDIAEDLTQDTLVKALRAGERSPVKNLDAWLFTIARHVVADHFRGSPEHVPWRDEAHAEAENYDVERLENSDLRDALSRYVRGVVQNLREPYREALLLTEYEGLTQPELAARLGISLPCAKSRVQRARAEVRRAIEECCRVVTDIYGHVTDCERRTPCSCAC